MIALVGDGLGANLMIRAESSLHAHHGVALFVAVDGEVAVNDARGRETRGAVVAVAPDVAHAAHARGAVLVLLLDHERHGLAVAGREPHVVEGGLASRLSGLVRSHRGALERAEVLAGISAEATGMLARARRVVDRRVARALELARGPSIAHREIVAASGLSDAHFSALFARDVGIGLRAYRLWRRTVAAVLALRRVDATCAAHDAGFADLAHFSRSCRRMLGFSPSEVRGAFQPRS